MAVALDPGIGEVQVGQAAVLAIGHVEADVPGATEEVAVLQLHLTEHTLALAVAETAGQLARGLLHDPQHDHHITGLLRHRLEGHLHITEKLGAVEALDVLFELVAVERVTGLNGDLTGDHPFLGLAANRITVLIGRGALAVEELNLNASNAPLNELQGHHPFRTDPLGT